MKIQLNPLCGLPNVILLEYKENNQLINCTFPIERTNYDYTHVEDEVRVIGSCRFRFRTTLIFSCINLLR